MLSIGDVARHGRVSVRMLRHYDAIGLLRPARVDPGTGYRFYTAAQLARLHRIVALRELGFGLTEVADLLDEQVSTEQMRGMLRLREAELHARIVADTTRLDQLRARLRTIESEGTMPVVDVTIKALPAVRVAELTATARGLEPLSIGPVVRALFGRLVAALAQASLEPTGPAIAYYVEAGDVEAGDDEQVVVHAALPVDAPPPTAPPTTPIGDGVAIVDLPAVEQAATVIHEGSMDDCLPTYQALAAWIENAGYRDAGPGREITLAFSPDNPADCSAWITEIQQPITRTQLLMNLG
ncbi:MerR family transcriptional regulator [Frankia sp. R82]|uniref:MerR family transcriptional regulator n=1 Tax=Frankia sp. R82 TaxID=2950553 RepID=UPI002044BBA6|nr:MerR family transcriptional regulator [Frankia sp. R82]MCM3886452.1 MerR family transcriptional regulator [Frankia sp. R82]